MLGVKLLEFIPQAVEFRVAQFWLSEVVVQVGMVSDLLGEEGDTSLSGIGGCSLLAHNGNWTTTGYEASLWGPSLEGKGHEFTVLKRASGHHGLAQNAKMNLGHHVDVSGEHMTGMGLQIVIGEGGVKVRKGVAVFSSGEVPLQRDKFGPTLQRHTMIDVVVVHVAVDAVSRPTDTAGDGGCVKANRVGQRLQRGMNFLTGVQPHEHVIPALGPLHANGSLRWLKRLPFIRLPSLVEGVGEPAPWP